MNASKRCAVLFVCMGNICRSPTAEGVFRKKIERAGLSGLVYIDSAGTHGYHIGEPPDERSQTHAAGRGYDLSAQRARKVAADDFERFDYLLAMDHGNLALLRAACPLGERHKLRLFMEFAKNPASDIVPDPYYGGGKGFELVLDYVENAADGLVDILKQSLLASKADI